MAEPLHTQKKGNSLVIWTIVILVVIVAFFGVWKFLNSAKPVPTHPPGITHSIPVGGKVMDGVFHPTPVKPESAATRWRI